MTKPTAHSQHLSGTTHRVTVCEDQDSWVHDEDGERRTRRVWFVAIEPRSGHGPSYHHFHMFTDYNVAVDRSAQEDANHLASRVEWHLETLSVEYLSGSPLWAVATEFDLEAELAPFGPQWEREEYERLGL